MVKRKIWLIIGMLTFSLAMGGCSDDGELQYLDETGYWEYCGYSWEDLIEETSGEETEETQSEEATLEPSQEPTEEETEPSEESTSPEETQEPETGEEIVEETDDDLMMQTLIGTWKSEPISVEDIVKEALKSAGEYEPFIELDDSRLFVNAKFSIAEDGWATMELDAKSYQTLMDYLTKQVTAGVIKYYENYLANMGLHVNVNTYLKMLGISPEKYVASVMQESTGDLNLDDFRRTRICVVEDGKLYLAESEAALENRESYLVIELTEDDLSFLQYYEKEELQENPLGLEILLPLNFSKEK